MAKQLEVLNVHANGLLHVKATDDDNTVVDYTITVPPELMEGTANVVADNIKQFLTSTWPTYDLEGKRMRALSAEQLAAALKSPFAPTGTQAEAEAFVSAKILEVRNARQG